MIKRGKSVSLDKTLRRLVQAFPQADHTLKVWPKRRRRLVVCRVPRCPDGWMVKRGKSVSLDTTLRRLVQAFPQADHTLKVWPKRSSLHSTVGRVPGSKRKLNTFL